MQFILLSSFSCQPFHFRRGDLDLGVAEVDPLDSFQFGLLEQDIEMFSKSRPDLLCTAYELRITALSMMANSSSETGSRWDEGVIGMILDWQKNEDKRIRRMQFILLSVNLFGWSAAASDGHYVTSMLSRIYHRQAAPWG